MFKHQSDLIFQISLVGLVVVYALNLPDSTTALVSTMTDTEKEFVAVERCRELTEETPREADIVTCSGEVSWTNRPLSR